MSAAPAVVGFQVVIISILLVIVLFVNCVALNTPIRFADVGVNVEPPVADIVVPTILIFVPAINVSCLVPIAVVNAVFTLAT